MTMERGNSSCTSLIACVETLIVIGSSRSRLINVGGRAGWIILDQVYFINAGDKPFTVSLIGEFDPTGWLSIEIDVVLIHITSTCVNGSCRHADGNMV